MAQPSGRAAFRRALVAVAASVLSAGCGGGDGLNRMPVRGNITFEGEPLAEGTIQFYPEQTNTDSITGGSLIEGGSYSIPRAEGLVPGRYQVRISSPSDEMTVEEDEAMPGLGPIYPRDLIPSKYNVESELRVEVTEDGPNEFDFALEADPGQKLMPRASLPLGTPTGSAPASP
ncbi:hypothetical protein [Tautonia sociabilis]|uniref:Carboxypeptidase regulatory-like domain-containing protein n=1 Tax=Tautonia sociabilis TaxID=2080755 RepID=A0A432ML35_9BACT|nr:hypothetical protein [Tautonia sociabilis]RUL88121.1 hypothetical protein TsocGM_09290 [Tautonia sociabilis]